MQFDGKYVDPYRIIGVTQDVTEEELKKKYKELVKKHHPDERGDKDERHEQAIRVLNISYESILEDVKKRDKSYIDTDLDELKNETIEKINAYINSYQVAKTMCDLNQDLAIFGVLSELFASAIAGAKNCIFLVNVAKTPKEIVEVVNVLAKKDASLSKEFFDKIPKSMCKELVFVYHCSESQKVLKSIDERTSKTSAIEWFMENKDVFIALYKFDHDLITKLDDIGDIFNGDELFPLLEKEIKAVACKIAGTTSNYFLATHASYHFLEGKIESILESFRYPVQEMFDKYHDVIERRKQKIEYLKFAFNISKDVEDSLKEEIHNGDSFNELYDATANKLFSDKVEKAQNARK